MNSAKESYSNLKKLLLKHRRGINKIEKSKLNSYDQKFAEYVSDDVNSPLALSVVWDALKNNPESLDIYNLILKFDNFLGLKLNEIEEEKITIPDEIIKIAEERKTARINKDYKTSDLLRDEINILGYTIVDKANNEYEIQKQ